MGLLSLPNGTLLVIAPLSGFTAPSLTPYSARGLSQTYELIKPKGQTWTRRDVNGVLRSAADTRFRKIRSTVTCKDGEAPHLDNAWIGEMALVDCAFEMNYPIGGTPYHAVVPHSERSDDVTTFYRPQIIMMIMDIRFSWGEWRAVYDWQIDLEEV